MKGFSVKQSRTPQCQSEQHRQLTVFYSTLCDSIDKCGFQIQSEIAQIQYTLGIKCFVLTMSIHRLIYCFMTKEGMIPHWLGSYVKECIPHITIDKT